ncbi:S49 family peptidase [Chitinophagaceae bacterium 26-R-25]|nr:S49 family peptidase [Chitinophagaceae bacterium 26-R-25]
MSFKTVSAILRGRWLIDKSYAGANVPMAIRLMQGEAVDFGEEKNSDLEPQPMISYAGAAYSVQPYSNINNLPDNSIAVVTMAGPMLKYGDMCSYGMTEYAAIMSKLGNAGNVSGIIIDIDSPGGQADGTALLSDTISRVKQRKPVISLINDGMAASAGYWIASSGTEVYVTQPTDQVGSIGVYTTIADWNAHYQEYFKLPVMDIYAPQSTDKNKDYKDAINGDDTAIKEDLSVLAQQFINTVKKNRAGKLTSDVWSTGKMFYAKDAQKIGLIDGIKSFDQVIARMNQLIN